MACPSNAQGTDVSKGCTCNAGFSGCGEEFSGIGPVRAGTDLKNLLGDKTKQRLAYRTIHGSQGFPDLPKLAVKVLSAWTSWVQSVL